MLLKQYTIITRTHYTNCLLKSYSAKTVWRLTFQNNRINGWNKTRIQFLTFKYEFKRKNQAAQFGRKLIWINLNSNPCAYCEVTFVFFIHPIFGTSNGTFRNHSLNVYSVFVVLQQQFITEGPRNRAKKFQLNRAAYYYYNYIQMRVMVLLSITRQRTTELDNFKIATPGIS